MQRVNNFNSNIHIMQSNTSQAMASKVIIDLNQHVFDSLTRNGDQKHHIDVIYCNMLLLYFSYCIHPLFHLIVKQVLLQVSLLAEASSNASYNTVDNKQCTMSSTLPFLTLLSMLFCIDKSICLSYAEVNDEGCFITIAFWLILAYPQFYL